MKKDIIKRILLVGILICSFTATLMANIENEEQQVISMKLEDKRTPIITGVTLTMNTNENINGQVQIKTNLVEVKSTDFIDLVGGLIKIDSNIAFEEAYLKYTYDETKLGSIKPQNMFIMRCDSSTRQLKGNAETMRIDTKNHTLSQTITEPGIYLVINSGEWIEPWYGEVADESSYEDNSTSSDHELKDITEIADTRWYNEKNTTFHIGTASELAGLAKLVNDGTTFKAKEIILDKDIDLIEYKWVPIGHTKLEEENDKVKVAYSFAGTFNGNYYKIKSMYVYNEESETGLFGLTTTGFRVKNLGIEGCNITGSNKVGGIVGSYTGGQIQEGYIVENSYVCGRIEGTMQVGGIVGFGKNISLNNTYAIADIVHQENSIGIGGLLGCLLRSGKIHHSYYYGNIYSKELEDTNGIRMPIGGKTSSLVGEIIEEYMEDGSSYMQTPLSYEIMSCFYNNLLEDYVGMKSINMKYVFMEEESSIETTVDYMTFYEMLKKQKNGEIWEREDTANQSMPYIKYFYQEK